MSSVVNPIGFRLKRFCRLDEMGRRDAELFHHDIARGAEAEPVDGNRLSVEADVAEPRVGNSGLD